MPCSPLGRRALSFMTLAMPCHVCIQVDSARSCAGMTTVCRALLARRACCQSHAVLTLSVLHCPQDQLANIWNPLLSMTMGHPHWLCRRHAVLVEHLVVRQAATVDVVGVPVAGTEPAQWIRRGQGGWQLVARPGRRIFCPPLIKKRLRVDRPAGAAGEDHLQLCARLRNSSMRINYGVQCCLLVAQRRHASDPVTVNTSG